MGMGDETRHTLGTLAGIIVFIIAAVLVIVSIGGWW